MTEKIELTTAEKEKAFLVEREAELCKSYKRIVADSIRREPGSGKLYVTIACAHKGCDKTREVATSDLFQVKFCEEHTHQRRLARRKAKVRQLKAQKVKKRKARKPEMATA